MGGLLESAEYEKASKTLVAGALARVVGCTVLFPLDTLKARLQFQRPSSLSVKRVYAGAGDACKHIIKEEGILALWKGLPVRLIYVTPSAAVSFTLYEQFKRMFNNMNTVWEEKKLLHAGGAKDLGDIEERERRAKYEPLVWLAAGAGARVIGTALRTPFDVVKERLQVQGSLKNPPYKSTIHAIRQVILHEGYKGLFNGYICTMTRDVPFAALYFSSYETFKYVFKYKLNIENNTGTHLVGGACAGAFAACCTLPMDVVKLKMQTQNALPVEERLYKNLLDCYKTIYREEGVYGFVRGWRPIMMKVVPSASVTFCCYEFFKKMIM